MILDLDEMGPESARSYPGVQLVRQAETGPHGATAGRARLEIDYGRRGKGYVFGALHAVTGDVLTACYLGRTTANWVAFLERVDAWVAPDVERVYAIVDNLSSHRAPDVLLFCVAHPRWEFVFQPTYAAYLNLIEPWWKILRSLALKGRRFGTWEEIVQAVAEATTYWNAHRHPFTWGHRRRHQPRCCGGLAGLLRVA